MTLALVFLVLLSLAAHGTQAAECLEPASRVVSRWKNGNYYKGEIESITNRVNVLFDNGARLAYNPRDNVDVVVDRIPDHTELPWGSRILVNRPKSRAFEIGYIRDIKNGRFVILYENGDLILHTLDQIRALNKSQICDEPAYLGCFRDNLPRDLQVYIPTHPATIGACVDTCKSSGFSVGALRNSDLCFCGNAYRKSNQVADKECDMPCYDNSFEVCGGFMTFSQYWTGIVDSPIGALPGIQKHFIPSNDPIPWELLMHARSKYPPRHMAGSTRGAPWYQAYSTPWKGTTNAASFQQQRISALGRFPSTYQVKPVYPPNRYQSYQSYYGAKPYTANYNGQLQQPSSRYGYQSGGTNTQPSMYGTYRSQANRWPYNYNYNNYKYRNYNFQNSAANRPYSGYQSAYQRRPAQRPSPQEHAKLMGMLKKVSWTLFKEITGTSKIALAAPRFLGCYQDSESRDLPTAIQVRPLTVEGCVSKCSESGFSIAGLQSSTQCFCGTTYSKYGRLQNDQCTMRCTGNYKEICGGVMMNSLYYTGVGQAVPYPTPSVDARAQQITFTKNTPLSYHTNEKPQPKPRPSSLKNPLSFHKVSLLKIRPKASKSKDKTVKNKPKKPTQLKHKDVQDKGRPLAIQDYGKLTKILQTLSKWRQPHKIRYNNKDLQIKPTLSYKELRKILEDMTPEIVKKIANKIIAHDMNRTKLSDMKPLNAEKSLEVHLASTKVASGKDTGFKRVQVKSNNYRNWSKKGSSSAPKVRNKHEDIVQEDDAKPFSSSKNGVSAKATQKDTSEQRVSERRDPNALSLGSTKEKELTQSQSQNNTISSETQESTRYATQVVPKVQPLDGNKIPSLPSFIPIADKRKQDRKKSKHVHDQQNGSKQLQGPRKGLMSDVQSNKRTFVHFIVTESDDKKKKLPKTKNLSSRNKTHFNETGNTDEGIVSNAQEKAKTHAKASIKNETKQNVTSQDNQTATEVVPSTMNSAVPSEDVDEVFETYSTPSNNTPVETEIKNSKNANVKTSNKTLTEKEVKPTKKHITHPQTGSKMLILKHPRIPHKVLHVEAKWNGQINVKANWKDVMEPETKPKKNFSVKKHNVNSKKKTAKKFKESSGDDEGSDEYKFDDSGSRNDLLWRHGRPLKDKIN